MPTPLLRFRAVIFRALILFSALLLGAPLTAAQDPPVTLELDPTARHQALLDGFGASGAWWPVEVGGWDDAQLDPILELLFSQENGAGLDLYRYNLGGVGGTPEQPSDTSVEDPWRRPFNIETAPGVYDFARNANALRVLRKVRDLGVEKFVIFANSPPTDLTVNGMSSGGPEGGPNLPEENEHAFAKRFVATAVAIAERHDLPHVSLSPINEPNARWGRGRRIQEGCHYPPKQTARVLAKVAAEMERQGLDPHRYALEGPEGSAWSARSYFDAVLDLRAADPVLAKWLTRLATHSYGGDDDARRALVDAVADRAPGLPIAMTEWTELTSGRDASINTAVTMSALMHRDLNIGRSVTWQKWIAVSKYDWVDGLIYVNPEPQNHEVTKRLWAMANWSRFIPPDSVRIDATLADAPEGLGATAFVRPDGGRVCVLTHAGEQSLRLALPASMTGGSLRVFVTDAERDLAALELPTQGEIALPAKSITTLYVPAAGDLAPAPSD